MSAIARMKNDVVKYELQQTQNVKRPPFVIQETPTEYQIAFNLANSSPTQMHIYVSQDRKRLHVTGRKSLHDSVAKFLLVFSVPTDVDPASITVDLNSDIYLIGLPKKTFWARMRMNLAQAFTSATHPKVAMKASFASTFDL